MSNDKKILMIGTNGIDCFYGVAQAFDKNGARIIQVHSIEMAKKYIAEMSFDAVIINLEPDGKGGIDGIDVLPILIESKHNQQAICFSISAVSATTLLAAKTEHLSTLSIIVGWLALPVEHERAVKTILDIIQSPSKLAIKNRLPITH